MQGVGRRANERRVRRIAALTALTVLLSAATAQAAAVLPAGFVDERVGETVVPTALAFTPDGKMLVASQPGFLFVYAPGNPVPKQALDMRTRVCSDRERGLLGLTIDPEFASNRRIYLYYTTPKPSCMQTVSSAVNRISRFVLRENDTVDAASETVLVDGIPSLGIHNAGDLEFGRDGALYATVGDAGCHYATGRCGGSNTAAQEKNTLLGKILRINRDGSIPADNPFLGPGTARCNTGNSALGATCQEIYSSGLRNPFRFAFDPDASTTRFHINDVGGVKWEEVDEGRAGANYGWPEREGPCVRDSYTDCGPAPLGMTNPLLSYRHDTGCSSVTGGAFIPRGGGWPAPYAGSYLFADFVCGKAFRLATSLSGGATQEVFATQLPSPVHFEWGPVEGGGEALYYTTFDTATPESPPGQIRRIRYVGSANRAPNAALTVTPDQGAAPLEVAADAGASSDPDGDALTFRTDFGDGSAPVESADPVARHTYTSNGTYTVRLTVRDPDGASATAEATVVVADRLPEVRVVAPDEAHRFSVGERIALRAEAVSADGTALAGDRITWTALLHHDQHTHPFLAETAGDEIEIVGPAPEDLHSTKNSHLEVRVAARDHDGTTARAVRELRPKLVPMELGSDPQGAQLTANGVRFTTPARLTSWPGYQMVLSASPDMRYGLWSFRGWSDGVSGRERLVTTGADGGRYTARYRLLIEP